VRPRKYGASAIFTKASSAVEKAVWGGPHSAEGAPFEKRSYTLKEKF
jgi:hypothetical protein